MTVPLIGCLRLALERPKRVFIPAFPSHEGVTTMKRARAKAFYDAYLPITLLDRFAEVGSACETIARLCKH